MRALFLIFILGITSLSAGDQKVVVVGAGLAGLTTAHRLHDKGVDVELYEAKSRVGGRIFTVNMSGRKGELGAVSIADGGGARHVRRLIQDLGLELVESRRSLLAFHFDGKKLIPIQQLLSEKHFDQEDLKARLDQLKLKSRNMKEILDKILEKEDSVYTICSLRLSAYEGAPSEKLSPIYTETLLNILLGGLSSVHQENYVRDIWIKGGNCLLPEKLAQKLGNRLHLDMPLIKVIREPDGYMLTFQNGQKVKAHILVLAIPCPAYKKILFEDVMNMQRLDAIRNVQYGTNSKILVPLTGAFTKTSELINDRMASYYDPGHQCLTFYYTGESGRFSQTEILNTFSRDWPMLEVGYGNECPAFVSPTFADGRDSYEGPVGYSWPNDPYIGGSYSTIAPGQEALMTTVQEENGEQVKTMFAPIDQNLYFVGEHTSILMDVPGTLEAACESGERAARMILKKPI